MKHYLVCPAPICNDKRAYKDQPNWESEVIWYPGEAVCKRSPYTSWQKTQLKINKIKQLKFPETYYTVKMLTEKRIIKQGVRGGNPEQKSFVR